MQDFTLTRFINYFHNDVTTGEGRYVLFLGAGCSVSSGIPTARELAKKWALDLSIQEGVKPKDYNAWITAEFPGYEEEKASAYYGEIFQKLFATEEARQKEIERICEGKDPGFGYAVLAKLLATTEYCRKCNVILTTNFDDLVADALYIFTSKKPLVIYHESLINFVRITHTGPVVIKLHGDAHLAPKNTREEVNTLMKPVKQTLTNLLAEAGIIFIGHGGHDPSITKILTYLPEGSLPKGVFWINDYIPDTEFGEWLKRRENVFWVKHKNFDQLMLLIRNKFDLSDPEDKRFTSLFRSYKDSVGTLTTEVHELAESEEKKVLEEAIDRVIQETSDWWAIELKANKFKKRDPVQAARLYEAGIAKFPLSSELNNNYAIFLQNLERYDEADRYYRRAYRLKQDDPEVHKNYAGLLIKLNRNVEAETHYRRALELKEDDPKAHNNYALLLYKLGRYYEAQSHYLRALELKEDDPLTHYDYAFLLEKLDRDDEAENHYRRTLELKEDDPKAHNNYATLLLKLGRYDEAAPHYGRALELKEDNAEVHNNYAILLEKQDRNDDAEKHYRRALDLREEYLKAHNNYALLLRKLGRFDEAESHYRQALAINGAYPEAHDDYANPLKKLGRHDEAENHYRRALQLISGAEDFCEYAVHVEKTGRDDEAESHYRQALEIAPNFPRALTAYAGFLARRKRCAEAREYARRFFEVAPDDVRGKGLRQVLAEFCPE
jgi:tetratricopeptide (TPR) repeat protein